MQPPALAAPADFNGGWAGWTQPRPFYAPMPMYGPPGVVCAPPPPFQQSFLDQQQSMRQYQAANPVLYSSTSTAFTYGLHYHTLTLSVLVDSGGHVSRLGLEYSGEMA